MTTARTAMVCAAGVIAAAIVSPASGRLQAQEHPLAPEHAGSWSAPDVRAPALPAEIRAAALALSTRLFDVVRRMPAMAPPAGFQVVQHAVVTLENIDHSDNTRLPKIVGVEITAALAPYERTDRGVAPNERDTAGSVTIAVNDLGHTSALPMGAGWADESGAFIQAPDEPVATRKGFPVYQEGNSDEWVLLRRHDAPLFASVTRERYWQALIMKTQDELVRVQERRSRVPAGVPASIVATIDEAIADQRARLASIQRAYQMSAVDRNLPAVIGSANADGVPSFERAGQGDAIMALNPALFDTKLPPATPQTMFVRVKGNEDLFAGLGAKLEQQLDWAALNALLR